MVDQFFPVLEAEAMGDLIEGLCAIEIDKDVLRSLRGLRVVYLRDDAVYVVHARYVSAMLKASLLVDSPAFVDISAGLNAPRQFDGEGYTKLVRMLQTIQEQLLERLMQSIETGERQVCLDTMAIALEEVTLTTLTGCLLGYPVVYAFGDRLMDQQHNALGATAKREMKQHPNKNCLSGISLQVQSIKLDLPSSGRSEIMGWSCPTALQRRTSVSSKVERCSERFCRLLESLPVHFDDQCVIVDNHVSV